MRCQWWWWVTVTVTVVAAVGAVREDEVPDALPDADGHDGSYHEDDQTLQREESRNVRPRAYPAAAYNALPLGLEQQQGRGASLAELAGYSRPAAAAAYQQPQRPQRVQPPAQRQEQELEEEDEREEPDRLAQLLQQSRFDCGSKQSGYYADTELACEVFHYCQDNVKHSWICPDGFTFHQVHLICMPPTHDNICQKSAKYHFVNDYLYRPVNEEEVQRKPSLALKYSDRYYPQEVYHDDRYDEREDEEEEAPARRTLPQQQQQQQQEQERQRQQQRAPQQQQQAAQVFRSAEEVNIPLGQRRPLQRPYDFDF